MYETYIRKTVGDHIHGFKTRMNKWGRSEGINVGYQRANSSFMSLIALKKNRQLEESFFYMYSCLESLETLFHKRGYDTMNNPSRNKIH